MIDAPDPDMFPAGLVTCDDKGRVIYANRCLLDWLEVDEVAALLGKPFQSFLSPAAKIYFATRAWPLLLLVYRIDEIAVEICTASGKRRKVHLTGKVHLDADGKVATVGLVCQDATQRHIYEQELLSRHGGLIEFESRPGRTVFFVRIPLNQAEGVS